MQISGIRLSVIVSGAAGLTSVLLAFLAMLWRRNKGIPTSNSIQEVETALSATQIPFDEVTNDGSPSIADRMMSFIMFGSVWILAGSVLTWLILQGTLGIVTWMSESQPYQSANLAQFRGLVLIALSASTGFPIIASFLLRRVHAYDHSKALQWTENFLQNFSSGMLGATITFVVLTLALGSLEQYNAQQVVGAATESVQATEVQLTADQENRVTHMIVDRVVRELWEKRQDFLEDQAETRESNSDDQ